VATLGLAKGGHLASLTALCENHEATGRDCRSSGAQVTYTVEQP
jgi:uncharacterized protein with NRDE domain